MPGFAVFVVGAPAYWVTASLRGGLQYSLLYFANRGQDGLGRPIFRWPLKMAFNGLSMMSHTELTFDAVDDLVGAYTRGRLGPACPDLRFSPRRIGPLVELAFQSSDGRIGPLAASGWLDLITQNDLRVALAGPDNCWLDAARRRGFLRTVHCPSRQEDDLVRTGFLMAARVAAEGIAFPISVAQGLTAAI